MKCKMCGNDDATDFPALGKDIPPLCPDCTLAMKILDEHGILEKIEDGPEEFKGMEKFIERNLMTDKVPKSYTALMLAVVKRGLQLHNMH
jgi:hypothetical protein